MTESNKNSSLVLYNDAFHCMLDHPDECRDNNLLHCRGSMQGTETGSIDIRASSNTEHITYGQDSHAGTFRETGDRGS